MQTNLSAGSNMITRTELIQMYYSDIPTYSPMTIEEERELFEKYHNAKTEVEKNKYRTQIICANLRFVIAVAKRYGDNTNAIDIMEEGNIGMIKAIDSFDASQGIKFTSYAIYYIVREISDYKTRIEPMVKKPNFSKTYHFKNKVTEILEKELGRKPRTDEIIEYIEQNIKGYNVKDASDLIDMQVTRVDDDSTNDDGKSVNAIAMQEFNTYSASSNACEQQQETEFAKAKVKSLLSYLKPLEREVIEYSFGINHYREYTLIEIGEKLNMSTERIRQLKISTLVKLKDLYMRHRDDAI